MIQLGRRFCIIFSFSLVSPMRLVSLKIICLTETCKRVRLGKNLSDMFPIRNGLKREVALSSLLFNFDFEYTIRRDQVNQNGLKLNGTHQLLVYADDVNTRTCILGGSAYPIKENAETLMVASKETGRWVSPFHRPRRPLGRVQV